MSISIYNSDYTKMDKDVFETYFMKKDTIGKWIFVHKLTFHNKDNIEYYFYKYECSLCGKQSLEKGNFCPNCGNKMKTN